MRQGMKSGGGKRVAGLDSQKIKRSPGRPARYPGPAARYLRTDKQGDTPLDWWRHGPTHNSPRTCGLATHQVNDIVDREKARVQQRDAVRLRHLLGEGGRLLRGKALPWPQGRRLRSAPAALGEHAGLAEELGPFGAVGAGLVPDAFDPPRHPPAREGGRAAARRKKKLCEEDIATTRGERTDAFRAFRVLPPTTSAFPPPGARGTREGVRGTGGTKNMC